MERITRRAYPDAAEPMTETLAKDQFIDALHNEDMRLKLRQSPPQNPISWPADVPNWCGKPSWRTVTLLKGRKDSNPFSVELLQQLVDALQTCSFVRGHEDSRVQTGRLGNLAVWRSRSLQAAMF